MKNCICCQTFCLFCTECTSDPWTVPSAVWWQSHLNYRVNHTDLVSVSTSGLGILDKTTADQKEQRDLTCASKFLSFAETFEEIFCGLRRQTWNFSESVLPVAAWVKLTASKKNIIPSVKHSGGSRMVLDYVTSSVPGWIALNGPWTLP